MDVVAVCVSCIRVKSNASIFPSRFSSELTELGIISNLIDFIEQDEGKVVVHLSGATLTTSFVEAVGIVNGDLSITAEKTESFSDNFGMYLSHHSLLLSSLHLSSFLL